MTDKTFPDGSHTSHGANSHTPAVMVADGYRDGTTGALYVHKDLVKVKSDWEDETHISPIREQIALGDVESWATYVTRFVDLSVLLTWNSSGLRGVLDYHEDDGAAGRCQWIAKHPFVHSPEWTAWTGVATGQAVPQKRAIEFLEDHGADIVAPSETELLNILRQLRGTVNKAAATELRPDGTISVSFEGDTRVSGRGGMVELPSEFTIGIPILKGHVDGDGKPVLYQLKIRLRASVDDQAHLALRFTIPNAERALEDCYLDRVNAAKEFIGEKYQLLRAAD